MVGTQQNWAGQRQSQLQRKHEAFQNWPAATHLPTAAHQYIIIASRMEGKAELRALLCRSCTFEQAPLYNRELVNPYLLASHGLVRSGRRTAREAVCSDPSCSLALEFDDGQELKEELELALRDHDEECRFARVRGNLLDLGVFGREGSQLYNEALRQLNSRAVWVQLNPKEVLQAAGISPANGQHLQGRTTNFQLQQLMQLDSSIPRESLLKVSSCVFLAVFGWRWLDTTSSLMVCQFCNSTQDVRNYVSPSEFSLMKVDEGFGFISGHKGWCCLVAVGQQFWKEILRQAALKQLENRPSSFSRSPAEIRLRGIQRRTIEIYGEYAVRLNELRRKLSFKRAELSAKQNWKEGIREELDGKMLTLENSAQQQKELVEKLIKSLTASK